MTLICRNPAIGLQTYQRVCLLLEVLREDFSHFDLGVHRRIGFSYNVY